MIDPAFPPGGANHEDQSLHDTDQNPIHDIPEDENEQNEENNTPPNPDIPAVLPQYWTLLNDADKNSYSNLKVSFTVGSVRRNRGHRIETFDGILDAIHRFAEQGNDDDWKRCLVCGVCWLDQAIAINTRQLRLLISKCKSSINGSLQKLGYSTNTSISESWKILFSRIPLLKDNFSEIRQWTIRYRINHSSPNSNSLIQTTSGSNNQNQMYSPALLELQRRNQISLIPTQIINGEVNRSNGSQPVLTYSYSFVPNHQFYQYQICQPPVQLFQSNQQSTSINEEEKNNQENNKEDPSVITTASQHVEIENAKPLITKPNFELPTCPLKYRDKIIRNSATQVNLS